MKRKVFGWLIILSIILSNVSVFAKVDLSYVTNVELDYWPGDKEKVVSPADCTHTDGSKDDNGVQIPAGGSATYEFFSPFNMRSVTILSEGVATLTIDSGDFKYQIKLSGTGEDTLEFAKNLGRAPQDYDINGQGLTYVEREHVEYEGEKKIIISSDADVTIKSLSFEKEKVISVADKKVYLPDISDIEMETLSTVFMDTKAPVIVVNGSTRYIDMDDTDMIPYERNGSIYLPIGTLAKALGYYHEDDPNRNYVLMRSASHEFVKLGDSCTVSEGLSERVAAPEDAIVYRNGKTFAAVRYFAELTGDTVGYKDGLVAIDNKFTVKDVFAKPEMTDYAKQLFADFKGDKVNGRTYYVAQNHPNASDAKENTGTAESPFKTIKRAGDVAKAGDTVIVKEGVYRETLKPANSGTATAPIVFRAAEGEKVVISAADELGKVAHYKDNVYVAPMPFDMGDGRNQIFIDGEMMTEARYPNGPELLRDEEKLSNAWPVRGNMYRPIGSDDKVESDTLLFQEEDYWVGGTYVGLFGNAYDICTAKIKASKPGELTLAVTKGTEVAQWFFWNAKATDKYNWGYISGHENAMDIPGEWIYKAENDGNVFIILPENADPETVKIEAKARELVVDLKGKSYVHVYGFDTIGGSARMYEGKMCMLNNLNMKYISHFIHRADARDGYIDFPYEKTADSAPQKGTVGIFISGDSNILANSVIDHSAGCGVYLGGLYSQIDNNIMKDCGYMSITTSGITFNTVLPGTPATPRGGFGIYNNTVYNVGRSLFNGSCIGGVPSAGIPSFYYAPYLPSEFAYNDFHDGMLASADTGLVYQYHTNHSFDQKSAEFHHNFVYLTIDGEDKNPFSAGIYWDGCGWGIDTYENLIFQTKPDNGFSMNYLFEQHEYPSTAIVRLWGNHALGYVPEETTELQAGYFTNEKPFYAGSKLELDGFESNYNRFINGEYEPSAVAREAEHSEGVSINPESGYAEFSGNDQYIIFKDVDFGDGSDELGISYRGNSGYTYDEIEVTISGDDATYRKTVMSGARTLDQDEVLRVVVNETKGVHDVKVKVVDYRSVSFGGVTAYKHANDKKSDAYSQFSFAGEFNDIITFDPKASDILPGSRHHGTTTNPAAPMFKQTWAGRELLYENQVIDSRSTHFAICSSSGGVYGNQPLEVYLNDKLVLKTRKMNAKGSWSDYTPVLVPLDEPIEPGTYDITLRFATDDGYNKVSNFEYFGFVKEGADLTEFGPVAKYYSGVYNADETVAGDRPLFKLYMNQPIWAYQGLQYTLPGTVLVYDNVVVDENCDKFIMCYSADDGYDGQPIEIRVNDLNSEPIATLTSDGNGSWNFNEHIVDLKSELPAGTYKVYISFGGEVGSKQTTQFSWFGFDN